MIRLLLLPLWVLALPFTAARWAWLRARGRPLVVEVVLEGAHPARARRGFSLRSTYAGVARRALREALRRAGRDRRVRTVSVRIGPLSGGWAELFELREALVAVRAAGKRVVAFVAHPDTRSLWVASASDEVLLPTHVPVDAAGLALELTFLGEGLERAGVDFDVVAAGEFKSAAEPLTRSAPSEANRAALDALLDDLYARLVADLGARPGCTAEGARAALDAGPHLPEAAISHRLGDALVAEEDVRERLGCHAEGDARPVRLADYAGPDRPWPRLPRRRRRRCLAIVEVRGAIREGRDDPSADRGATARAVCAALDKARGDRRIAGVLLHIDSRGGSATASERMWRAARKLAADKPVVAWLGDYAASGGYYVASAAHEIVATPGTVTGSIGVIAAKPVLARLLGRIGVHRHRLERGPQAAMFSPSRAFTAAERAAMEASVGHFYRLFIGRVAAGRERPEADIEPVAEGRVWTGQQALAHGLVDTLGDERAALERLRLRAALGPEPTLVTLAPRRSLLTRLLRGYGAELPAWVELALLAEEEPVLAWCPVELKR